MCTSWQHVTYQSSRMQQIKLANLGTIVVEIDRAMPHLLQCTMPNHIVHRNIKFQIFPDSHSVQVNGATAYKTLQKMIQLGVSPWLVPNGTKLSVLSLRLTEEKVVEDRRLHIHWRTISPDREHFTLRSPLELQPGRLISSLGLLPEEYPVLAGSFEFGFDQQCETILLHILRNVEYMAKPDSQLICT